MLMIITEKKINTEVQKEKNKQTNKQNSWKKKQITHKQNTDPMVKYSFLLIIDDTPRV